MPIFGDYETLGEPIAVTEEVASITTVWQARKSGGGDPRLYAIKCYEPRRQQQAAEFETSLTTDGGLEFLESVKQFKRAQAENPRSLIPIHAFGTSDEGAWYATDFYARKSLQAYIARRGAVDDAILRYVVYSLADACRALVRSVGRSHGKLKASNVLLAGKPRPIVSTPLHIADIQPASLFRAPGLDASDRKNLTDLLRQAAELQDLQSIGMIVLQLVEGREVRSAYDFNYPIGPSPDWDKLGKHSTHWRELCNKLLDPQLKLEDLSLAKLATDYKPSAIAGKMPMILAGVGGACLVLGVVFLIVNGISKGAAARRAKIEADYQLEMKSAHSAFDQKDYPSALAHVDEALKTKPAFPEATQFKNQINDAASAVERGKLTADYRAAADTARNLLEAGRYSEAAAQYTAAADVADRLKDNAAKQDAANNAAYANSLSAAKSAEDGARYAEAVTHLEAALQHKAGDPRADNWLKQERQKADNQAAALRNQQATAAAALANANYDTAMKEAQTAFDGGDFGTAVAAAKRAQTFKADGGAARDLQTKAETRQNERQTAEQQQRNYLGAVAAAQAAYDRNDYTNAISEAKRALSIKQGSEAQDLLNKADAQQKATAAAAEKESNYKAALALAQSAFDRNDFATASKEATRALSYKATGQEAKDLQTKADAQYKIVQAREQTETGYKTSLAAAQSAFNRNDFTNTVLEAKKALSFKQDGAEAIDLQTKAEAQLKVTREREEADRNYVIALGAAQASYDRGDYTNALTQVSLALAYKSTGPEALALQGKLQKESGYQSALASAQTYFNANEFSNAVVEADRALGIKSGGKEAADLKSLANAQLKAVQAREEKKRNYAVALGLAQAALSKNDWTTAINEARRAVGFDGNGTEAKDVLDKAVLGQDTAAAQDSFSKGKYDDAAARCQAHTGVAVLDTLASSIAAEKSALSAAQKKLDAGDYSLLGDVNGKDYAAKPPFSSLVSSATTEQKALSDLQAQQKAGDWRAVQSRFKEANIAPLAAKPPFKTVSDWAGQQATAEADKLKQIIVNLDSQLEVLLVKYGEIKSQNATTPTGRRSTQDTSDKPLDVLDADGKAVNALRTQYQKAGILSQPMAPGGKTRDKLSSGLLKSINSQ